MFETQNEIAERNGYICSAAYIQFFPKKVFSQQLINGWCENDEWGRQKINYSSTKDFKLSIHETSNLIVLTQFIVFHEWNWEFLHLFWAKYNITYTFHRCKKKFEWCTSLMPLLEPILVLHGHQFHWRHGSWHTSAFVG